MQSYTEIKELKQYSNSDLNSKELNEHIEKDYFFTFITEKENKLFQIIKASIIFIHQGNKSKIFRFFCLKNKEYYVLKIYNSEYRLEGDYEKYINERLKEIKMKENKEKKILNILEYKGYFYTEDYFYIENFENIENKNFNKNNKNKEQK